ncbi:RNA degradosome polyphosphate kinase [Halalkalibacter akibai]|uniref:Polyphosphate kinase n=1 Tax=Halalkalibacter akibai (strain ATCC 43226 / DSM 21942 / CIP 109018 / JCM 9157 / 1139) TaxID=1236973 RepID=W4R025_HALA3|nr:RNA degradosome polyphosphate kinase [Halalkalibacter akibai]GAE37691.1 polyphosphate kinase [Halalkalibacter akibai JCM 9157]
MEPYEYLDNPCYYNNRELSWLAFNQRVLEEALDERNLLLERFKFLAIFSSNLDEFFMVRVAGLKDQVKVGFKRPDNKSGLTPNEQLTFISEKAHELVNLQYETYRETLLPLLRVENIEITSIEKVTEKQKDYLFHYFKEQIFPVLTPMAIDAYRPFPKFLNKSLNLAILLDGNNTINKDGKIQPLAAKLAIVQVPSVLTRFIEIPSEDSTSTFVLLEDIIAYYIETLFSGFNIKSVTPFRITRNADLTIHEDGASDLLSVIEQELKKRKWGSEVRLEIVGTEMDSMVVTYLQKRLEIQSDDTYLVNGPLDLTFLFSFHKYLEHRYEHLIDDPIIPQAPQDLPTGVNLFEQALNQDILLHHPYESFEPVVEFVARAAEDPNVLAIKQTLYRVSGDSSIIKALKRAAGNGKQVTVLVELKARFDEENNVSWAKELEKEGCHVIYGMTKLKTHSKITLVVRRRNNQIERFVHLGTGNYNDATARLYTDVGLITSNEKFGIDASNFFNYISGYTNEPTYHHLSVAPYHIREDFIKLIDQEISFHEQYGNGYIIAKMNSLSDKPLIKKLYEASIKGVKIDLIIRGICCLKPGVKGISENIRVISILGRFLEHSRIYYFNHNGAEKTFFSSADLMTRNMENRIEILFPILDQRLRKRVKKWLLLYLADDVKAREQDCRGNYYYVENPGTSKGINSQLSIKEKNTYERIGLFVQSIKGTMTAKFRKELVEYMGHISSIKEFKSRKHS